MRERIDKYKIALISFGISVGLLIFIIIVGSIFKGEDKSDDELDEIINGDYTHYVGMYIDDDMDDNLLDDADDADDEPTLEGDVETTLEYTTESIIESTSNDSSETLTTDSSDSKNQATTEYDEVTSKQPTTSEATTKKTSISENEFTTAYTGEIATSMDALSYKVVFENSVIMGDSIASGFSVYGVLDENSVVAKVGIGLSALDDEIAKAAAKNPERIFCYYGFNDIGYVSDYEKFKDMYANFVKKLKASVKTSTKIYACAIFPALSTGKMAGTNYANTAPYNEKIKEVCKEYGISYIDCSEVLKDKYYYDDGYHFRSEMYPYWLELLLRKSGIIE